MCDLRLVSISIWLQADKTVPVKAINSEKDLKMTMTRAPLPLSLNTDDTQTSYLRHLPIQRVRPVPFEPHPGRKEANNELQSWRRFFFRFSNQIGRRNQTKCSGQTKHARNNESRGSFCRSSTFPDALPPLLSSLFPRGRVDESPDKKKKKVQPHSRHALKESDE